MRGDWVEVELGLVCEKAQKVKRNEMPPSESFIYLDIGGLDNELKRITGHKIYTWEQAPSRAQQLVKVGDVLFSTVRTYLKNIAPVTDKKYEDQICSSGFTVIRGKEKLLESKYVLYTSLYEGFLQPLNKLQTGTSYPAVRDSDVFAQVIPLPPLPEQRAIIAEIEQLFSKLDYGIANLKAGQEKLVIYRQAVLKKAFEGSLLTEVDLAACRAEPDWEPAEQLLARIQTEKGAKRKTEKSTAAKIGDSERGDWVEVELGLVCEKAQKVKRKEMPPVETFLYLDIGGINNELNRITGHKTYTWEKAPSRAQQVVKVGDVLFSTVRTYLRNIALVTDEKYEDQVCSSGFTVIRGKEKLLESRYALYLSLYEGFLHPLYELQTGTSYPAVRDSDVFTQVIPLAPLPEQRAIIKEIESRLSVCDHLQQAIEQGLQKAEALRQSVLKKAFEGRLLTETELADCRVAPDWEPAQQLLARIQAKKREKHKTENHPSQ